MWIAFKIGTEPKTEVRAKSQTLSHKDQKKSNLAF